MTPAMRAKISRAVKASFRRRRSGGGSRAIARRSSRRPLYGAALAASQGRQIGRRRRFSVSRFGGGSLVGSFKSALSKPMLMKAGGAVVASLGVGMLLQKYGASLPMSNNKWGRVAYSFGLPVAAAYLVRKKSPHLAEGLVIGGLVMGINALIQQVKASTGAVAGYPVMQDMGVAGELGYSYYPSSAGVTGSPAVTAFSPSAWS